MIDISVQRLRSGLEQQSPSRAGPTALRLIGEDRLIPIGRDETDAHYAARLAAWRYPRGHRIRGSAYALLEQISEYFGGDLILEGIDRSGNLRSRAADGVESHAKGYPWTWDDGAAAQWARQWIVIEQCTSFGCHPSLGDAELWGGTLGTSGYCVGIRGASAEDWRAIRRLTQGQHRWLPAGTQAEWLCVMLSPDPLDPDATWAKWGKLDGVDYVPSRSNSHRYVAMRDVLREYAGDEDWANRSVTALGTFVGDDTDFPSAITLPDGSACAGDPTDFPLAITLPDDGSLPS